MEKIIYVIGIGPGDYNKMTVEAIDTLKKCDCIVGYTTYIELLRPYFSDKEMLETPMKSEVKRCRMAFEIAMEGKRVAMVSSGDAGVYGMAGLMYEIGEEYKDIEVLVIPGVTAACSGAAVLGAPLMHDFAVISLSDLMTPLELIEKRLRLAAEGDFSIVLYNPSSHKRADYLKKACNILMEILPSDRVCGYVKNIGREATVCYTGTLEELANEKTDMFTTVFIGNSTTRVIGKKLVTKRGYNCQS